MADVGRNDPCPCGSGKKYKHCHWRIDQQMQRQDFELERAWRKLGQQIWDFGIQDRFAPEFVSAWELFWDNKVPVEAIGAIDMTQRIRFMDWFMYDYRTSRNRKRIAELFLDVKQADLSSLERDLVRDWVNTHVSVYEVTDAEEERLDLRDVFTDDEKSVEEAGAGDYPLVGALLFARLLPLGGSFRFTPSVTPMPADAEEELFEFIRPRFKAWQEARYGADWDDFLREAGYLLNHFLIRDMEPMQPPAMEEPEMDPRQAARSIARRMQNEIITTSLHAHYDQWLDKPIPEWGGKTPQEMLETPKGAEKIEVFLDLLEDIEEDRAEAGQPTLNVEMLRRKLGLTKEPRTEGGIILPG